MSRFKDQDLVLKYDDSEDLACTVLLADGPSQEISQRIECLPHSTWTKIDIILIHEERNIVPGTTFFAECILIHLTLWRQVGRWFAEIGVHYPDGEDQPDRYVCYFCNKFESGQLMTRAWMGQNYVRVLLNSLLSDQDAIEIATWFSDTRGGKWPERTWYSEKDAGWYMYLGPEDDWHNAQDPAIRPAWRVPLPDFETLRQQDKDWNNYF
ncbi:MAG: hypothetical protein ACTHK7_03475 [Aureliella sp.]